MQVVHGWNYVEAVILNMRYILTLLLLTFSLASVNLRLVTEVNSMKIINGDQGYEFLIKTSIAIHDQVDLKLGFSEAYTAPRSSVWSLNHAGQRVDIGFYWNIANDFKIGYTHSMRNWFDGANPKTVFIFDSIDMIRIRKEFDITI